MSDPSPELIARCRKGDPAAFEALYRRHVDRVWRFAWLRTRSREAAGEIVQETFLRVARSIGSFQGRSAFSTWLYAVTRSVAVEHARKNRDRPPEPGMLRLVPPPDAPADRSARRDVREAVRRAVAELPGAQRDAIVLYELSGLSVAEVAELLGWTPSRVKVTLFRARRRLRDKLGPHVGEGSVKRSV